LGTWGTYLELDGNSKGTHWEPRENKNKIPSPPPPNKIKKKKKKNTVNECLSLLIGCKKFLFPKEFITIFGLG